METVIELDSRGRASLGRLAEGHDRFLADTLEDGSIVLTPAVVVSEREMEVLRKPQLIARLRAGVEQAEAGQVRPAIDVLDELGL